MEGDFAPIYKETKQCLYCHGKSENDVKWVIGTVSRRSTWERFEKISDLNDDQEIEATDITQKLYVVGDNWWLERHQYDEAVWWEYKEAPQKPSSENSTTKDLFDNYFWEYLCGKNHDAPTGSKHLDRFFEDEIKLKKKILEMSRKPETKE